MIKRVNNLEELGEMIELGMPAEVLYDLGKGKERTELLVTSIDRESRMTNRIASSPLIRLHRDESGTLMDITDSDEDKDRYSYKNLRPLKADFEQPTHSPYELGDLTITLEGGRQLGISQYARAE
ncbi:MAG TPA: hypothetical protein ENH99_00055 [Candidatus Pacearchaeota archaeon]|nr:hypothetical protein [Candidatus Pacearchaeota archaeon]